MFVLYFLRATQLNVINSKVVLCFIVAVQTLDADLKRKIRLRRVMENF